MPRINGSFDFFFATGGTPAAGGAGARWAAGNGALFAGGSAAGFDTGGGTEPLGVGVGGAPGALDAGGGGCGGCGKLDDVGKPVGPVSFGKTTVGAEAAMVSSQSCGGLLAGTLPGGAVGTSMFAEL